MSWIEGEIEFVYLAPSVPEGWPRCLVVTLRQKGVITGGAGSAVPDGIIALLFDFNSGELLAEFDLREIHGSLTGIVCDELRAEVKCASVGPDGEIGLALWFSTQSGAFYEEIGVWDGYSWAPVVGAKAGYEPLLSYLESMYMGPGKLVAVELGHSIQFQAVTGGSKVYVKSRTLPRELQDDLTRTLLQVLITSTLAAVWLVGSLALIWSYIPRIRTR
jgi:hypothetical protein